MSRLEELYDKMTDEAPFNFKIANKPYILELSKLYAEECIKASLEKASRIAKTFKNGNSGSYRDASIDKESITQDSNIVLL